MGANESFRAPDKATALMLLGVGLLVGFLVTYFSYERKEAECDELADSYLDANKATKAVVFAACFNPKKYELRPVK